MHSHPNNSQPSTPEAIKLKKDAAVVCQMIEEINEISKEAIIEPESAPFHACMLKIRDLLNYIIIIRNRDLSIGNQIPRTDILRHCLTHASFAVQDPSALTSFIVNELQGLKKLFTDIFFYTRPSLSLDRDYVTNSRLAREMVDWNLDPQKISHANTVALHELNIYDRIKSHKDAYIHYAAKQLKRAHKFFRAHNQNKANIDVISLNAAIFCFENFLDALKTIKPLITNQHVWALIESTETMMPFFRDPSSHSININKGRIKQISNFFISKPNFGDELTQYTSFQEFENLTEQKKEQSLNLYQEEEKIALTNLQTLYNELYEKWVRAHAATKVFKHERASLSGSDVLSPNLYLLSTDLYFLSLSALPEYNQTPQDQELYLTSIKSLFKSLEQYMDRFHQQIYPQYEKNELLNIYSLQQKELYRSLLEKFDADIVKPPFLVQRISRD
jgi:hypothetical protein